MAALTERLDKLEAQQRSVSMPSTAARLEASIASVSSEARSQVSTLAKNMKSVYAKLEALTTSVAQCASWVLSP